MTNIVILGSTGMLGSRVLEVFINSGLTVFNSSRHKSNLGTSTLFLDPLTNDFDNLLEVLHPGDYVINCIGVIKPHIDDNSNESVINAIKVNSLFPRDLYELLRRREVKVIQIATDCVYSGLKGDYTENDMHDCLDVYGKTKSLGEVAGEYFMNLRCSIIGPERNSSKSLFEWINNQEKNANLKGFDDHFWNGVTTTVFGQICLGIVKNNLFQSGTFHLVPKDKVSKYELLSLISESLNRHDLIIDKIKSGTVVNRTLSTNYSDSNEKLWNSLDSKRVLTISEMIKDFLL
jgi:dTDP-4-dehydrorhamnose reductase